MTPGRLLTAGIACVAVAGCSLPSPAPGDPRIRARANAAATTTETAIEAMRTGPVIASAWQDGCRQGQHGWKVNDGYDWECGFTRYQAVEFRGTLRQAVTAQHKKLLSAGCRANPGEGESRRSLPEMLDSYEKYASAPSKLPSVRYQCADQMRAVAKISDPSESSLRSAQTLTAWSTGIWPDRVIGLDPIDQKEGARLTDSTAPILLLVSIQQRYHRA